jgi:protein AbiQ
MLKFYDINPEYANYLRQFDNRIPNIVYEANNKFVCGIVLSVNKHNYFAPISSNTAKQQTSILIQDDGGNVLSSIKFCFMFPAPNSTISVKDFGAIRALDQSYADLLEKEYAFCKKNEQAIIKKASKVYDIGCNPEHALHKYCCNFPLLEAKHDEWVALNYLIG